MVGGDRTYRVAQDVQTRRFHDELVLLDLVRGEYFALDEVGSTVWEGFARGLTVAEVVATLTAAYDTDASRIEADVLAFTDELLGRQLLVAPLDAP